MVAAAGWGFLEGIIRDKFFKALRLKAYLREENELEL